MCTQCLSAIISIILSKKLILAILFNMIAIGVLAIYCNFFFVLKYAPHITQVFSEWLYYKYTYNLVLILIYGKGRCSDGQLSKVLIEFGLEEDQQLFNKYLTLSYSSYVILLCLQFLTFWMKLRNFSFNSFNFLINTKDLTNFVQNKNQININNNNNNSVLLFHSRNIMKIEKLIENRIIVISWFNLSVILNRSYISEETIKLLDNISGGFESNTLNAIMGPSGAGKTTLLRCLSGRGMRFNMKSQILIKRQNNFKTCLIEQNIFKHLLNGLTVRQTLLYASKLKNSRIIKVLDHNQIVSDLMSELLISDTKDNRVESCSGGEQKRIVIASELISYIKPNILLIDEPTSGLDTNAAQVVVHCLKKLSRSHNMTIITTIHQPNQDLFQMFDSVYVLAKGGVYVYSGLPNNLRQHLNNCQIECTENQISIEVLLKHCSEDKTSKNVCQMLSKTNELKQELGKKCIKQNMRSITGHQMQNKRFNFKELNILFRRSLYLKFIANRNIFLIELICLSVIGLGMYVHHNKHMTEPNGCMNTGFSCQESNEELIYDKALIKMNLKFYWGLWNNYIYIISVFMIISYNIQFKISSNEIFNRE